MKINLNTIEIMSMSGEKMDTSAMQKAVALNINNTTNSLQAFSVSEKLYSDEEVELSDSEMSVLISAIDNDQGIRVIIKKAIINYLTNIKNGN